MKYFLSFLLLSIQILYSKNVFITNDTLAKLDFESLRLRLVENSENKKIFSIYNDYYIRKAKASNDIENLVKGYGFKVENYPFKEALKNADSMLYLVKNKCPKLLYLYYYKIGNLYCSERKNSQALDYYLKAYKNCDKKNEIHYNAIKMQIGIIRTTLGQYEDAATILEETKNYYKSISMSHYLFQQYALAVTYNDLLEIEKAKEIIDNGLILSKKENLNLLHDYFIMANGVNKFRRKEYQKSLNLLLYIFNNTNFVKEDYSQYAFVSYYIGKSYQGINKNEIALKYFKKVDSVFVKFNDIYYCNVDSYEFLIDYYKSKNDLKKQLVYSERLNKAKDLLINSTKYASKKLNKNYDIPNLIDNKNAVIEDFKFKNIIFRIIISLLILGIGFAAFAYYRKRKREKAMINLLKIDLNNFLIEQQIRYERKKKIYIEEEKKLEKDKLNLNIIPSIQNERGEIDNLRNQDVFLGNQKEEKEEKNSPRRKKGQMSIQVEENILEKLKLFVKNKEYLKKTCSLDNLAEEFGTNKTYLSKIINEKKGYSFSTFVNNLRIEHTELLQVDVKTRQYAIEYLADEVGYNNYKAFTKAFKNRMGLNPSIFIKNMK